MPRTVTILQARMGSSRLPGKSLMRMAGKPLVQWCLERLSLMRCSDALVLATSQSPCDDLLAESVRSLGYRVFRGSETDVLDRYYQCARDLQAEVIVRATGDNPFVDHEEADRLIEFLEQRSLDYACGETDGPHAYPIGVSVEVIRMSALAHAWQAGCKPHHREHVNEYLLEHPQLFRQEKMGAPASLRAPRLSLTVDTAEQFQLAEARYEAYMASGERPPVPVDWLVRNSELPKISQTLYGEGP